MQERHSSENSKFLFIFAEQSIKFPILYFLPTTVSPVFRTVLELVRHSSQHKLSNTLEGKVSCANSRLTPTSLTEPLIQLGATQQWSWKFLSLPSYPWPLCLLSTSSNTTSIRVVLILSMSTMWGLTQSFRVRHSPLGRLWPRHPPWSPWTLRARVRTSRCRVRTCSSTLPWRCWNSKRKTENRDKSEGSLVFGTNLLGILHSPNHPACSLDTCRSRQNLCSSSELRRHFSFCSYVEL